MTCLSVGLGLMKPQHHLHHQDVTQGAGMGVAGDLTTNKCPFRYELSQNLVISICQNSNDINDIVLDIRQFVNGRPTIKGIGINYSGYKLMAHYWHAVALDVQNLLNRTNTAPRVPDYNVNN